MVCGVVPTQALKYLFKGFCLGMDSLSKKPKNTPWVYSGDELGGLEKPK